MGYPTPKNLKEVTDTAEMTSKVCYRTHASRAVINFPLSYTSSSTSSHKLLWAVPRSVPCCSSAAFSVPRAAGLSSPTSHCSPSSSLPFGSWPSIPSRVCRVAPTSQRFGLVPAIMISTVRKQHGASCSVCRSPIFSWTSGSLLCRFLRWAFNQDGEKDLDRLTLSDLGPPNITQA